MAKRNLTFTIPYSFLLLKVGVVVLVTGNVENNNSVLAFSNSVPAARSSSWMTQRYGTLQIPNSFPTAVAVTTVSTCLQALSEPNNSHNNHNHNQQQQQQQQLLDATAVTTRSRTRIGSSPALVSDWISFFQFALFSMLAALCLIGWEDITCTLTLPSRNYRTAYLSEVIARDDDHHEDNMKWGQSTIRGMGFGYKERMLLLSQAQQSSSITATNDNENDNDNDNAIDNILSYNEIIDHHWKVRVPQWRKDSQVLDSSSPTSTAAGYSSAIHTLCECLASLSILKDNINNYQWDTLRTTLRSQPCWVDLEWSASRLRRVDEAVGFDWGSCAWRGNNACNALADAQEAIGELDFLSGVLQPYEALFCLDIIERSIRDMLVSAPWNVAQPQDVAFWKLEANSYIPHRVFDAELEDDESERIDDDYIQALQALRID